MLKMSCWCAIALLLLYTQEISTTAKIEDVKDYRLPKIVKPVCYQIAVAVEADFYTTKKFKGHVKMTIDVLEETSIVVMHSANITYDASTKYKIKFDEDVEKMTLTFGKPLKVGLHDLEFNYQGILHEDMNGFYLSYYEDVHTKEKQWIATTQFQATYARRAFPCFDEPEFKAEYQVNVTRPLEYNSLSNTVLKTSRNSSNSATDVYTKTPKMSSYLVAFIVSKFKGYGQTNNITNKQYDVYCPESALKTAGHAYDIGQKFVDRLSKYVDMNYYEAGIPKLNLVGIPDFSAGAMENWGLVTYREAALLFDENESPASIKSRVSSVIAHELAHMWFGDMVTTEWWSTTWLNEGFAEYFSYFITDEVESKWELLKQFVVKDMQRILYTDALSATTALTSNASSPTEIVDKFNTVTYSKGAAIVRMMHFIMGDTPFLNGIRDYIKNNMYKCTKPSDLWKALSQYAEKDRLPENTDFGAVMSTWVDQPGYPVVYAFVNGDDIVLTQKRFSYNKTGHRHDNDLKWYVPLTYTTSLNPNFKDDNIYWLTPAKSFTFEGLLPNKSDWFVVNLMQYGFYRVQYDAKLWERIDKTLKSDSFTEIDPLNRAQIIDDMFNLAKAGLVKFGKVLDMTLYLTDEINYYPWVSAIDGFKYLKVRTGSDKKLQQHILTIMSKLYDSVSFNIKSDSPYIEKVKTALTLNFACSLEHPGCLGKATALFEDYKNGKKIDPNLRKVVYCNGIRQSHTNENWKFLWNKYLEATLPSERDILLESLACSKEKNILLEYLKKSITKDSGIRKQDAEDVFTAVYTETSVGQRVAYKFFKENVKEISQYYQGMDALSSVILTIAEHITTKEQLQDFQKFLKKHSYDLKDAAIEIEKALEKARFNLQWPKEEVSTWLNNNYNAATIPRGSIISLTVAVICVIYNYI